MYYYCVFIFQVVGFKGSILGQNTNTETITITAKPAPITKAG